MTRLRVLPCGDTALLVEVPSLAEAMALHAALTEADLPGVVELVPGARTVLVRFDARRVSAGEVGRRVGEVPVGPGVPAPAGAEGVVEIAVRYDGPELEEVGAVTGLGPRGVVDVHTGALWRVAFSGFAPGFAYLTAGDERLRVPRRETPRTSVPAGAVGLAGEFTGVYPRPSPGGWQLIGRTDVVVWDLDRDPPALLRPGAQVRFRERR
ncbi:MAG: allophanate hydrolase subunit 1 [Actinomycetota bacterium]|nr:allophanate hydrolase subunit 1 [Actinomycetota bacterium]